MQAVPTINPYDRAMTAFRILILGGYGQFGARIARGLARDAGLQLTLAGRHHGPAQTLCEALLQRGARAQMQALALDLDTEDFQARLAQAAPDLLIHTAGPFQQRDYRVAEAALALGAHYIDLADAREFVTGVGALDEQARRAQRWAITGASSVPGLSAAVIEAHRSRFGVLESIESAIAPGNRSEPGLATTRAILGYVGRPHPLLQDGRWIHAHGWQSLRRLRVPGLRTRWLARCDVPDLALLPQRYPDIKSCDFRAGLELKRMHLGLWLASWAVRAGVVRHLPRHAERLLAASARWRDRGGDTGLMRIDLRGRDRADRALHLRWTLRADNGDGPQVPATAAIVLARKLASGALPGAGARACLDFFSLDEFTRALEGYAVTTRLEVVGQTLRATTSQ
jgi:hypothetical protein